MKTAKSFLAFALVLTLLLSLGNIAFADTAAYQNTKAFLREIDGYTDLTATLVGVIDFAGENYEQVKLSYKGDASDYTSHFSILFNEDQEDIVLYMGQVIKFDESRLSEVMTEVNKLNAQTTGVKLYVDTSENTVSAELFQLVTKDSAAELSLSAVGFLIGFTDKVFERLSDYAV
jgi:outer membrane lipoprotein-sorting protein